MNEGTPIDHTIDRDEVEGKRVMAPSVIALGRLWNINPVPIPAEWVSQADELTQELFDSTNVGSLEVQARNKQMAGKYFGIDDGTLTAHSMLAKEFDISRERVRQIMQRYGRVLRLAMLKNPRFGDLLNLLPFYPDQFGSTIFGDDITRREVFEKLQEGIKIGDFNLSDAALENLKQYQSQDVENDSLSQFLSRNAGMVTQEIMDELIAAYQKNVMK